jgi:hypothetical protein
MERGGAASWRQGAAARRLTAGVCLGPDLGPFGPHLDTGGPAGGFFCGGASWGWQRSNGVKVVVLSRPAAAWRRGLYGPVLGPAGPAGSGMPLLPRPDGYRDSGGGSSLPRGCGAAVPGPCRPSFSVLEVSFWFAVKWRGWCQGRGGACWWVALMEGRLRILRVAVLWGSGEILVGLPTLTW